MNKKKKIDIVTWSVIGLAVVSVGVLIYTKLGKNSKNKLGNKLTNFKKKLIDVTNSEWEYWDYGKTKETASSMYSRLKDYWSNVGWSENRWTPTSEPWSAAFISYVMKKAGAGNDFVYNASHSKYIRDAIKNRKENNSKPFKAYRLSEQQAAPELGDLVCYSRESKTDLYDRTSGYKSHCDIVVNKTVDSIDVIGGNVGHTVQKKTYQLNSDGTVKKTGKLFAVIKNSKV